MSATLSILGLWNWDGTIFDRLALPNGVDRDTVINNILMEGAEFEILYPDPAFLKLAIGSWSAAQRPIWEKLFSTTKLDYDPISNYDRKEHWEEHGDRTGNSNDNSSGNVTNSQRGYNASTFVDATKAASEAENAREESEENNLTRDGRAYGNIGVTTTQQMIQQEREIAEFSIYNRITKDFLDRFCLRLY